MRAVGRRTDREPFKVQTGRRRHRVEREELSEEDLADEAASLLPQREAMSLIMPGAAADTVAAEHVPAEAQQWHGNPNEPHVM